jgi:hypothetical protein
VARGLEERPLARLETGLSPSSPDSRSNIAGTPPKTLKLPLNVFERGDLRKEHPDLGVKDRPTGGLLGRSDTDRSIRDRSTLAVQVAEPERLSNRHLIFAARITTVSAARPLTGGGEHRRSKGGLIPGFAPGDRRSRSEGAQLGAMLSGERHDLGERNTPGVRPHIESGCESPREEQRTKGYSTRGRHRSTSPRDKR